MPKTKAKPVSASSHQTLGNRSIYNKWITCGKNAEETARQLVLGKSGARQVRRAVEQHEQEQAGTRDVAPAKGRTPMMDVKALYNLKRRAEQEKRELHIIRPNLLECKRLILVERKKMLVRLKKVEHVDLCDETLRNYPMDEKTELKYINIIWPEKNKSRGAAENREAKKWEIRNFISCAAVAGSVFDTTNPDCIITNDAFAVYLDENGKMEMTYAAEGSSQVMHEQHLSIGTKNKKFVAKAKLPVFGSIAMSGWLISLIAEVWDASLHAAADGSGRVVINGLDPTDPTDFLSATTFECRIAHGTPHEYVMYEMYSKVIIPKSVRHKQNVMSEATLARSSAATFALAKSASLPPVVTAAPAAVAGAAVAGAAVAATSVRSSEVEGLRQSAAAVSGSSHTLRASSRSRAAAADAAADPALPARRSRSEEEAGSDSDSDVRDEKAGPWVGLPTEFDLCMCMDGDSPCLSAILDEERMALYIDPTHRNGRPSLQKLCTLQKSRWGVVNILKWAAGCSLVHSPNDVARCHLMARTVLKKSEPLTRDQCAPGLWACKERLEASDIPPDRIRSFWHLLSNLPAAASEAFRPRIVRDGWQTCGYYPFTPLLLMSRCTLWLRSVEDGGLSAAEKMAVLNGLPALKLIAQEHGRVSDAEIDAAFTFLSRYSTGLTSDLGDLATNRDRCALLVHPEYFASKKASAAAAREKNPALRQPRGKTKVVRARQKWEAYDERSNRCHLWEIEAQLTMRGVPKGYATTKPAMLLLWQTHSAMPDLRPVAGTAAHAALGFQLIINDDDEVVDSSAPAAAGGGGQPAAGGAIAAAPAAALVALTGVQIQAAALAPLPPASKMRVCSACKIPGHQKGSRKCPKSIGVHK